MRARAASAEQVLHGDDRHVLDIELGLFGVFDGVGSIPDSDRAADLAARTIATLCRDNPEPSLDALVAACDAAQETIMRSHLGATTATVAWIGDGQMNYVSIGDSRLYLARDGNVRQLTQDQGEGNLLDNVLGELPPPDYQSLAQQNGTLALEPGDKLILVTDGITGDFPPDLLSLGEIEAAVAEDEPQAAADNLIQAARKHDDRTAVVVFFDGG